MSQPIIVEKEKRIDASPERVWQFVEPAENISKWFPQVLQSETISGKGLGRKQLIFLRWGKKDAEIVQEVIEYVEGSLIKWKHLRETINGRIAPTISKETFFTIRLYPDAGASRITLMAENIPGSSLKSILFKSIAKPRIEMSVEGALQNIETGVHMPPSEPSQPEKFL